MKPDTRTAMYDLIARIRAAIPFDLPEARVCEGECRGCSQKLLDYLEEELGSWERRLADGVRPHFGDLAQLAGSARKIHRVLERNGLVEPPAGDG